MEKMKCPVCDGRGFFPVSNIATKICQQCNGTGEIEMTNDEWRKTCSAEEFAEWLTLKRKLLRIPETNYEAWLRWLKEKRE